MNWTKVGRWLLLACSLVLGLIAGHAGFVIFEAKVPAGMQTTLLAAEARGYYYGAGVVLGFAIFALALLGIWIAGKSTTSSARKGVAS